MCDICFTPPAVKPQGPFALQGGMRPGRRHQQPLQVPEAKEGFITHGWVVNLSPVDLGFGTVGPFSKLGPVFMVNIFFINGGYCTKWTGTGMKKLPMF